MSADWPPFVTVTIVEALRSSVARAERDRQLAASCGMTWAESEAFCRRVREFDTRTPTARELEALEQAVEYAEQRRAVLGRVAEWEDTRAGMLARIDAVIADLDDQLANPPEERHRAA